GGGLAGSTAAAMLGRAGIPAVLIDPHPVPRPDFRVEKLSGHCQLERFRKTGLAEAVLPSASHDGENWIARFGILLDRKPSQQYGIMYDALINAIRAEIAPDTEVIYAKAAGIRTSAERQKLTLSNGEEISARLVVLANGLNVGLRHMLGIERRIVSRCHSISLGFDLMPTGRASFDFPALTYFSDRPHDRIPSLTLFPVSTTMRANLFAYREMDDPCLRQLHQAPERTFYDDPVKQECDAWSAAKAWNFRSVTIDDGVWWHAQRTARFVAGLGTGTLRRLRNRFARGSRAADRQARPALGRLV